MENGIYQVQLSSEGNCVEGVVVIREDAIDGGGGGYICQGAICQENEILSGRVMIKKWDYQAYHALGLFKEVYMAVTGSYDSKKMCFHFQGQANGHHVIRVSARGHWVAPLF